MTYVPIIPHTPQPPSPRARELADQIARVIATFEDAHPAVTKGEVRQAAQLALRTTSSSGAEVVPVVLMLVLLVGVVAYFVLGAG
jgi:hypothetical protein